MRIARRLLNSFLKTGAEAFEAADPSVKSRVCSAVVKGARYFGFPIPSRTHPKLIEKVVLTISDSVVRTPYGKRLEFREPLLMSLSATNYCPFACKNCYSDSVSHSEPHRNDTDLSVYEKVAESAAPFVIISGGEPSLAKNLNEGLRILLDAGKFVYLSINGNVNNLIDLAVLYPQALFFMFPVWGTRREHNRLRGQNSFERIERNLSVLARNGLEGKIYTVVSDENLEVFDTLEELAQKGPISAVSFTRKVHVGRKENSVHVFSKEYVLAFKKRAARLRRYVKAVSIDIPEIDRGQGRFIKEKVFGIGRHTQCAAGNWLMHIDEVGNSYPCFVFERRSDYASPPMESIAIQWQHVKRRRQSITTQEACVGENSK